MHAILSLAVKDLRILLRVKAGLFFTFVWPAIVAVLFGAVFSGQSQSAPRAVPIVVVDEDGSEPSRAFIATLESSGDFAVERTARAEATDRVRRGERPAYVAILPGFGAASERLFHGERRLEIGNDPARQAEGAMIEGLLTKHAMADLQSLFGDPAAGMRGWQPLAITRAAVARQARGPSNGFDITFPQGVLWGILGCVMSFAIGLVSERIRGTFVRLQMSPLTRRQILAGKALACFTAIAVLQVALFTLGVWAFGIRIHSIPLLVLACTCASAGFVGFMMMVAGLGRSEQAASGAGWAMLMPMTLFGGGMMPQFIMPAWMQAVGQTSPVKWAILGMEGAVWRGFGLSEMLLPCGLLLAFGSVCFLIGVRGLRES